MPTAYSTVSDQSYRQLVHFYIGLFLAILSSLFIGISFIFKKKGLVRLANNGTRAGDGGFGYLRDWMWWTGMVLMALGEFLNFAAYTMAPASLVTPLGALSVLITALLSPRLLGETLNLPGKLGCLLCVTGSTMVVLHAPKEQEIQSSSQLMIKLMDPTFVIYTALIICFNLVLIFYLAPIYGQTNPLVYLFVTSMVGSLTVMACKAFGVVLKEFFTSQPLPPVGYIFTLIVVMLFCLTVQMNYLNKALDIFNTGVVTPILYVLFTAFVIIASATLFREWEDQKIEDGVGNLSGMVTIITGIFLLQAFKDLNISMRSLNVRVKRDDIRCSVNGISTLKTDTNGAVCLPA